MPAWLPRCNMQPGTFGGQRSPSVLEVLACIGFLGGTENVSGGRRVALLLRRA